MTTPPFDVDLFLRAPLTARVATGGPTVRPGWFPWEEAASRALLSADDAAPPAGRGRTAADLRIALVVDACDIATGLVRRAVAHGRVERVSFGMPRRLVRRSGRPRHGVAAYGAGVADRVRPQVRARRCRDWRMTVRGR
ncbi:pyridoxamine 5'-phosphate oxidase family protein [Streptomyces sp. NPDC021224]|uniref:pyridoxamine 5'-phosphate oxidase family protein n=1 Tax=unclassified Streptomyces TaxID=2593676 RepID=UPI0037912075